MDSEDDDFSELITRYTGENDDEVRNTLVRLLHSDLRRIARNHMRRSRWMHTMNTTVLVNETYLRLVSPAARHANTRAHFLNLASTVMRQILCDYARKSMISRKNLNREVDPVEAQEMAQAEAHARDITWLNDALLDLAKVNERAAKVVECRFFGGLSEEETAQAMSISVRTVERTWAEARNWLAEHLKGEGTL